MVDFAKARKARKGIPALLQNFLSKHKGASEVVGDGGSGESWKPKPGDTIEGRIVEYKAEVGENEQNLIILETPKGDRVTVWLTAMLDSRIKRSDVGKNVAIYFEKTVPSKKKGWSPTKVFRVYMAGKGSKGK